MKLFKKIAAGLLAVTMVASLAACNDTNGSSGSSEGGDTAKKPKLAVMLYQASDAYIASVSNAIKENASDYDVELLEPVDCKNDQSQQNEFVQQALDAGCDVIAVNVCDVGAASTVADMAKAKDVPIIFFNREPSDGANVYASYDQARFVGTKIEEAGVLQGEMIAADWEANKDKMDRNGDGKLQYVMLQGEKGNAEAAARTKYSVEAIKEAGIEVEELASQPADWDTSKAAEMMNNWISQYKDDIDVIICNNDGMAEGAITSIGNNGFNKGKKFEGDYISVYGVDATTSAQALIKSGTMTGTIKQDNVSMAKAILAMAENIGAGKEFIEGTSLKYDDSGKAVRIAYQKFTDADAK